ncbi:MAG: hypothetical protein ACRC1T_09530 [Clostridium chrysemydis]|uniref:hypothetical protein n=1 Tax=Clostridium chrysemydis TaxID=2665504 RepID=UPI003F386DE4
MNLLDLISGDKVLKITTFDGDDYFVESIDFVKRHIVVKNHKEFQQGIIEFDKISKWINVEK